MDEEKIMAALRCKARNPETLSCPECPYSFKIGNIYGCDTPTLFGDVLRLLEEKKKEKE